VWQDSAKLAASDRRGGDLFGRSLSVNHDGGVVVVGAPDARFRPDVLTRWLSPISEGRQQATRDLSSKHTRARENRSIPEPCERNGY